MGADTQIKHGNIHDEVAAMYEAAVETLCGRVIAEPYNFHTVDSLIVSEMLKTVSHYGNVIAEAQKQFRSKKQYTAHSVAAALKISAAELSELAIHDATISLPAAFDLFFDQHGRKVESIISLEVPGYLAVGKSSEEIKVISDTKRREAGLSVRVAGNDGKDEFEAELINSLEGRVIDYPIKPPIESVRKLISSHEPGEYIIIGGRTGMGKTYLALNYIYKSALENVPTAYINLENTPKNVQKRVWQMHSEVKFKKDLSGLSMDETRQAMKAWEEVKRMPFKSHHTGRNCQTILNTIRQDYYDRGIQLAVIDYIQLMKDITTKGTRAEVIGEISAEVRALCLDLKIPLIALAQMNRETEKTSDKRPKLSELKGSGDLEQDAATVMLLFRPEYYSIEKDENGILYPENYADIHIAKGRDVGTAIAQCRFNEVSGFYDVPPVFSTQFPIAKEFASIVSNARPMDTSDIPF